MFLLPLFPGSDRRREGGKFCPGHGAGHSAPFHLEPERFRLVVIHEDVGTVQEARNTELECLVTYITVVHDARDGEGSPTDQIGDSPDLVVDQFVPRHDADGVGSGNAVQV